VHCHRDLVRRFSAINDEIFSDRLLVKLGLKGAFEQELSADFFFKLIRSRTAKSILFVVFNGIFKKMWFSTVFENLIQFILPRVIVGNFVVVAT